MYVCMYSLRNPYHIEKNSYMLPEIRVVVKRKGK